MSDRLSFRCDSCHQPIPASRPGWIHLTAEEERRAWATERAWEDFEYRRRRDAENAGRVLVLTGLSDMPRTAPGRWTVTCDGCTADDGGYGFTTDRCSTVAELLDWTLHLLGKSWGGHTDWESFARRHVEVDA